MPTYYVDSNATYAANHANNGTASGTPWGGVGGIQRALSLQAAGETINIKAGTELDLRVLKKISHGAVTGGFALDDFVIEVSDTSAGTPDAGGGQGYVVRVVSTTETWIEVTAGTWNNTGSRYVWKDSSHYSGAISVSPTMPGLTLITAGSASAGRSKLIGVNASWAADGTLLLLDGGASGAAANGISSTAAYTQAENVEIRRTVSTGLSCATATDSLFRRCGTHHCGGSNPGMQPGGDRSHVSDVWAYSCTTSGIQLGSYGSARRISSYLNVTGLLCGNYQQVRNSTIFANTGDGISTGSIAVKIAQCVIDGNGVGGAYHGVKFTAGTGHVVEECRITNNGGSGGYGIYSSAAAGIRENYNVFYGNNSNLYNVDAGPDSLTAASTTEEGYTNQGSSDFRLTTAAILRRLSVALTGSNVVYVTAGLSPVDNAGGAVYPPVATVWHTAGDYGPSGVEYSPATSGMHASDITNCTAANIAGGVHVDNVTGTMPTDAEIAAGTWDDTLAPNRTLTA
jgi:hypothetical protein